MNGIVLDMPEATAFWSRVNRTSTCWEWMGSTTSGGYGNLRLPNGKNGYAHRIAYRLSTGDIPEGLVIDHLCRNRRCVRPDHLEPVTAAENIRRGASPYGAVRSVCKHGHDISVEANVYTQPNGDHRCRVCAGVREDARRARRALDGDGRKVLKSHCHLGHPFDEANTYTTPSGQRRCRECSRLRSIGYRAKERS